nr:alpha/beta hydrolase [Pseudomonadota bacterium]
MYREQRWTSADGLELYCRVYDGPAAAPRALTVLCLPGLTRNSRDFEALAPHLAANYRVVCPDLRGRGFSARDPQWHHYHPGTYLADLQRLLEVLELRRVAIVGTSLGGILGMMLGATA